MWERATVAASMHRQAQTSPYADPPDPMQLPSRVWQPWKKKILIGGDVHMLIAK